MREDTLPLTLRGKVSPNSVEPELSIQAHWGRLQESALSHLEWSWVATGLTVASHEEASRGPARVSPRGVIFQKKTRGFDINRRAGILPTTWSLNPTAGATRQAQKVAPDRTVHRADEAAMDAHRFVR